MKNSMGLISLRNDQNEANVRMFAMVVARPAKKGNGVSHNESFNTPMHSIQFF